MILNNLKVSAVSPNILLIMSLAETLTWYMCYS